MMICTQVKLEESSGLNGIRTHDFCDTGAVLYQLSYQVNCWLKTVVCITATINHIFLSCVNNHTTVGHRGSQLSP